MHIEPELISPEKMLLAYGHSGGCRRLHRQADTRRRARKHALSLLARAVVGTIAAFAFLKCCPITPSVSARSTSSWGRRCCLFWALRRRRSAWRWGCCCQGLFFAPFDLPQYAANVTTLLVPLFAIKLVADRLIAPKTAYVDISYTQALTLSATYQGGVVLWVAFWALYGQGFGAENVTAVASFGAAYMLVVLAEPLVDLAVLAGAKLLRGLGRTGLVTPRLYS